MIYLQCGPRGRARISTPEAQFCNIVYVNPSEKKQNVDMPTTLNVGNTTDDVRDSAARQRAGRRDTRLRGHTS